MDGDMIGEPGYPYLGSENFMVFNAKNVPGSYRTETLLHRIRQ